MLQIDDCFLQGFVSKTFVKSYLFTNLQRVRILRPSVDKGLLSCFYLCGLYGILLHRSFYVTHLNETSYM